MPTIDIEAAKTDLSRIIREAPDKDGVVLTERGEPVARLLPIRAGEAAPDGDSQEPRRLGPLEGVEGPEGKARRFGTLAGKLMVPDDFDAPLPDEILDLFEGRR